MARHSTTSSAWRVDVFVVEQECAYAELDGADTDPSTRHYWIALEDTIVAYLRTAYSTDGTPHIGRVVTDPKHRHSGRAGELMEAAIADIDGVVRLDAQSYLAEWYRRFGFEVCGPEYDWDGIAHVPMLRRVVKTG